VSAVPSWNFTFGRSLKRIVDGPVDCQETARQGSTFKSLPRVTSGS
jgi:hypothetical protein